MDHSLANELYAESLQLSRLQLDPHHDDVELFHGDGSLWDGSDDELDRASDLDREWQRRHDQFHTIGYRDGLMAGKETSSQQGFNIGFKQSVLVGYNWGLVRGVTSALACLPDGLREKLIETEEQRTGFQGLYESVRSLSTTDALKLFHDEIMARKAREQSENAETSSLEGGLQSVRSLSTTDALKLFHDEIMARKAREQSENAETSSLEGGLQEQTSGPGGLGNYSAELRSLLESPAIKVHLS